MTEILLRGQESLKGWVANSTSDILALILTMAIHPSQDMSSVHNLHLILTAGGLVISPLIPTTRAHKLQVLKKDNNNLYSETSPPIFNLVPPLTEALGSPRAQHHVTYADAAVAG